MIFSNFKNFWESKTNSYYSHKNLVKDIDTYKTLSASVKTRTKYARYKKIKTNLLKIIFHILLHIQYSSPSILYHLFNTALEIICDLI